MEKRLKSSMKENKRYLLLETEASKDEIEQAILDYLGVLGHAKSGLQFIDHKILAVNREELHNIRAALCLCQKHIKVKKASGTLKGLKKQSFKN